MRLPLSTLLTDPHLWLLAEKEDGDHLSAGQLFEEMDGAPLAEAQSRVIVPKRGKLFEDDGSMKIAIIRPCISRGKRLGPQKLPPIYEPRMLESCAGVFSGWPMYMDHMVQEALEEMAETLKEAAAGTDLVEWLEERSRSIRELGGRIVKSWWDPELTFEDDEEYGFQKGGVVGSCIPQDEPKRMLEADPGILQTSINAWPTGARVGEASWDSSQKGMLIEGIRKRPMGSVDWVFRAGAGGRPLLEEDADFRARAVSLLESVYSAATSQERKPKRDTKPMKKKLSEMTAEEAKAYLKEQGAEHLIEALAEDDDNGGGGGGDKPLTRADVKEIVKESLGEGMKGLAEQLEEDSDSIQEKAQELLEEREEARVRERKAEQLLREATSNGFPEKAAEEIRTRYTLTPSSIPAALQIQESDLEVEEKVEGGGTRTVKLTAPELIERRIRADIDHVIGVLRESGAPVMVKGFGPSSKDPGSEGGRTAPRKSAFRQFLAERKIITDPDPEKQDQAVKEMIAEGAGYGA